jgi:hypothetical protein
MAIARGTLAFGRVARHVVRFAGLLHPLPYRGFACFAGRHCMSSSGQEAPRTAIAL